MSSISDTGQQRSLSECQTLSHTLSDGDCENPRPNLAQAQDEVPRLSIINSALYANEDEETIITSIRATDVVSGLRRVPAGFYAAVHHSGLEWRTENKPLSVNHDVVEWTAGIPIPLTLSADVRLEIYASFELQPMLGTGEQLRRLTITTDQLLGRSASDVPFTFFPKTGDIVSPCSAISVTTERQKCDINDLSRSAVCRVQPPTSGSRSEIEHATNEGHGALTRFRMHGSRRDLDRSIELFDLAYRICPLDHPCRAAAQSNLAMAKFILFRVQGTDASLEIPINLYRDALTARPVGHVDRPSTLIHLAMLHLARFERLRSEVDKVQAGALLREAMGLSSADSYQNQTAGFLSRLNAACSTDALQRDEQSSPVGDPFSRLQNQDPGILSDHLLRRFQRFGDLADLQQGIALLEQLVRSMSLWDLRYCAGLTNLASALLWRFEHLGELRDLEDAITMHKKAIDLTPDGHPDKPIHLNNLGNSFLARFGRLGDIADIDDAISKRREAIELTPDDHANQPRYLNNLGMSFYVRFEHLGHLRDLEDAISTMGDAVSLTPHGHPDKPSYLNNLGTTLSSRFKCAGALSDIESAISMHKDAVDSAPHDHRARYCLLNNLGNAFLARFQRLGELGDLENGISTLRDAVTLIPHGHPQRPNYLSNFGVSLRNRFARLGELGTLEDAISVLKEAVDLTPRGHPDRPSCLSNLGNCLVNRFKCTGELSDLEDAITWQKDAVVLTPPAHPRRRLYLSNLSNSYFIRFESLGELKDLEDAISIQKDVVMLTPHGHPDKLPYLSNLGAFFHNRFELLVELNDLEDAISMHRAAVDLAFDGHPQKHDYLSNLGHSLKTRFDCLSQLSNLEDAISTHRKAIELTPYGHPHKSNHLNNLGICFLARFKRLGELGDLEEAISILTDAANLMPDGRPDKPPCLKNLGGLFLTRFERLEELSDLEEGIRILRDAVRLTHQVHPDKPLRLVQLGDSLLARFQHFQDPSDIDDAISLYTTAASAPFGRTRDRLHASQMWISCARHTRHWSLLHAYSVSVNLLPQLAWIGLSLQQRYAQLLHGADVVREAAAAALDAGLPEIAVEWLERGRSIVWGELFQLRGSYEELSSVYPDHASRLRELSAALEQASTARERSVSTVVEQTQTIARELHAGIFDGISLSTLVQESEMQRRFSRQEAQRQRTLAIERDRLLLEIRKLPGFERFLLHREFSQLRASAHTGPVVILNAAKTRCDALIVLAGVDHVIHVPLPRFTFERSAGLQNMLEKLLGHARGLHTDERVGRIATVGGVSWESLLTSLWRDVVKLVLHALGFSSHGRLSRIFWCPTGPFTFLPIHAAGLFDTSYPQLGNRVFDFVISSYVPTLSILTPSPNSAVKPSDYLRLLVVRQPPSDGLSRLPGVVTELERIRAVIRSSPSPATLLETSTGTVEEVLEMMKVADWVHFACHGIQDGVNSGLCLADGRRLRVRDIIAFSRPRGGLAFLSACQTAMGEEQLSDEAIHIAAGMLFAGYGGVIGTMWSISDKLAPDVARDVYGQLLRGGTRPDHREAARALHEAIGHVRDDGRASFATWIPFVHVGL